MSTLCLLVKFRLNESDAQIYMEIYVITVVPHKLLLSMISLNFALDPVD